MKWLIWIIGMCALGSCLMSFRVQTAKKFMMNTSWIGNLKQGAGGGGVALKSNELDEVVQKFDKQAEPLAEQVGSQSCLMFQKVSQLTKAIVSETQTRGLPTYSSNLFGGSCKNLVHT